MTTLKKTEIEEFWKRFKIALAIRLVNELARRAPVDTGNLKNSINYRIVGNVIEIHMAAYAFYVEFGTPPHIIEPKNAKALHFQAGGEDVFTARVNHPGTRPQPFIRSTLRNLGQYINESIQVAAT